MQTPMPIYPMAPPLPPYNTNYPLHSYMPWTPPVTGTMPLADVSLPVQPDPPYSVSSSLQQCASKLTLTQQAMFSTRRRASYSDYRRPRPPVRHPVRHRLRNLFHPHRNSSGLRRPLLPPNMGRQLYDYMPFPNPHPYNYNASLYNLPSWAR